MGPYTFWLYYFCIFYTIVFFSIYKQGFKFAVVRGLWLPMLSSALPVGNKLRLTDLRISDLFCCWNWTLIGTFILQLMLKYNFVRYISIRKLSTEYIYVFVKNLIVLMSSIWSLDISSKLIWDREVNWLHWKNWQRDEFISFWGYFLEKEHSGVTWSQNHRLS